MIGKPLSVELYSLRERAEKDFASVLGDVAEMGYAAVQPAGFWNIRPAHFKKMLDDCGLKIFSSHSTAANPRNVGECMDVSDALGIDTVCCGYGADAFKDLDAIKRTAEITENMARTFRQNGFTLFQHNHAHEFERLDGKLKYEIYKELCPTVKFEIDAFWSANFGAEDPVEIMKKFADRTIIIHIKDGLLSRRGKPPIMAGKKVDLVPLGCGDMDIPGLLNAATDQVREVCVELDYCLVDMTEAIARSCQYMTENGFAIGGH